MKPTQPKENTTVSVYSQISHLPATGVGAGTTLPGRWEPKGCPPVVEAESGRFRLRLSLLNRGWALSSSCSGSVRGLKCLHRHDFIFNSIWLRSVEVGEDGEREELKEELFSEVFVSEVLANLSVAGAREVVAGVGEGGGGGDWGTGRSSMSGSSPWKMLSKSVYALSSNTLREKEGEKGLTTKSDKFSWFCFVDIYTDETDEHRM